MKLVIDANIPVSAYAAEEKIREYWRTALGLHNILISPKIFAEAEMALRQAEFGLTSCEIRAIWLDILDRCKIGQFCTV